MSRSLTFHFPMPPTRNTSADRHWGARHSAKKSYFKLCDQMMTVGKLPDPPRLPFARAVVTGTVHSWTTQDDDNVTARMKFPLDWLKQRGYIVDDRRPYLTWANIPEQVIDRSGRDPVVILQLVEVEP